MNYDNDNDDDESADMFAEWRELDAESAEEGQYIFSAAAHIEKQVWRMYDSGTLDNSTEMDILVATMVSSFMARAGINPDGIVEALINNTDGAQASSVVVTRALPAAMLAAAAFSTAAMRIALGGGEMAGRVRLPNEKADVSTRCVTTIIQMAARACASVRNKTDADLSKGVTAVARQSVKDELSAKELEALQTIDSLLAMWEQDKGNGGHHG